MRSFDSKTLLGILLLSAIGISLSFLGNTSRDPNITKEISQENESESAKYTAKRIIEAGLKAPSTAQWPPMNQFVVRRFDFAGSPALEVSGYVDAQNSYGAMIRTSFKTTLLKSGREWVHVETKTN